MPYQLLSCWFRRAWKQKGCPQLQRFWAVGQGGHRRPDCRRALVLGCSRGLDEGLLQGTGPQCDHLRPCKPHTGCIHTRSSRVPRQCRAPLCRQLAGLESGVWGRASERAATLCCRPRRLWHGSGRADLTRL